MMAIKYVYTDAVNKIRVEEHTHTVRITIDEAVHLTPNEADQAARALTTAAARIRAVPPGKRSDASPKDLFSLGVALIGLTLVAMLVMIAPVRAQGACGAIREFDRRQACIAVQSGSPADCTSVRDSSDREICRIRARNRQELRDPLSYPRYPR